MLSTAHALRELDGPFEIVHLRGVVSAGRQENDQSLAFWVVDPIPLGVVETQLENGFSRESSVSEVSPRYPVEMSEYSNTSTSINEPAL